jgi:hypothetical protein
MQQDSFQQQWMLNKTLQENERENMNISELVDLFFEQKTTHKFSEERLFWLAKWLNISLTQTKTSQESKEEQESRVEQVKVIEFLYSIWDLYYFHPFVSPTEAEDILRKNGKTKFVVALSSTQPNMFRVSFYSRDTITHKRMHLTSFVMNSFVMEEKIDEIIRLANPGVSIVYKPVRYTDWQETETQSVSPYGN